MLAKSPPPVEVKRWQRNCSAIASCRKIRLRHTQQKNDHSCDKLGDFLAMFDFKISGLPPPVDTNKYHFLLPSY